MSQKYKQINLSLIYEKKFLDIKKKNNFKHILSGNVDKYFEITHTGRLVAHSVENEWDCHMHRRINMTYGDQEKSFLYFSIPYIYSLLLSEIYST